MINHLKKLTQIPAISGYEERLVKFLNLEHSSLVTRRDHLGSLIVFANDKVDDVDVLINTHLDEKGYIVSRITEDGLLELQAVGSNNVPEVGSLLSVHYNNEVLEGVVVDYGGKKLLNVGFENSNNNQDIISSMVTYTNNYKLIKNLVYSKALDNRVGVSINSKLIDNDYKNLNVASSFTTLSYLQSRGARTSSYIVDPKLVINIDLINTNDLPSIKINKGPVLVVLDQGVILNNEVKTLITNFASKTNSRLQLLASNKIKFDTSTISLVEHGVHTVTIGVPAQVTQFGELVNIDDINSTYEFINNFLKQLKKEELASLYNY